MARRYILLFLFIHFKQFWLLFASGCHQCCLGCGMLDCQDWYDLGHTTSGVYHVTPCGTRFGYDVYCDMETDGGGWLVFQRREDGTEDFYRKWKNYELGFGNITREFWLGLLPLRRIISQGEYEIRVDLEDFDNQVKYAKYSGFSIGVSASDYKLEAVGYSGNAETTEAKMKVTYDQTYDFGPVRMTRQFVKILCKGSSEKCRQLLNCLEYFGNSLASHNGFPFSTSDKDNDNKSNENCAVTHKGAWWFNSCRSSHLNGHYYWSGKEKSDGINWRKWERDDTESNYSLKKSEMKIRRV